MLDNKYNLDIRFFYNTLNENEKKLYEIMVESFKNQEYAFDFPIMLDVNYFRTYDAVLYDFPELFYVDYNSLMLDGVDRLTLFGKTYYTKAEIDKLNCKLDKILHKFDRITDPIELQKSVMDFIAKEYTYCMDSKGEKSSREVHTVAGLLKRKKGVCSAFAKLAQYIFQNHGIPTIYMIGVSRDTSIKEEDNSHAWLCVKLGGSYYHFDPTAMLNQSGCNEDIYYDEFNITDEQKLENYYYEDEAYKSIVCDKSDYNYFNYNGLYFNTYDEIKTSCTKFVKEMDYKKEELYFDFRVAPEIDTPEVDEYVLSKAEIDEILKDTKYQCSKFTTVLTSDDLGYHRFKIVVRKPINRRLTVVQPKYYWDNEPSKNVREFLKSKLDKLKRNEIMVFPEYSNAGGTSDIEEEKSQMQYANEMKEICAKKAKERKAYVAVNVLEERDGKIRNSTYLYNRRGEVSYIYDKVHLPPSEIALGVCAGDGDCTCVVDGIRFAFLTCYDIYFSEQIEHIAKFKPDIIIFSVYQRGELSDIIKAQASLLAYRCNAFVLRSSYTTNKERTGGCSMIVEPIGNIVKCLEKEEGVISHNASIKLKCFRRNGFGGEYILNDEFVNNGLRSDIF